MCGSRAGLRGNETGSTEHITVYTNIENPGRPFGSVYTLDEDNALTVDFAIHSMRVRSSGFPLPNFDREYVNAEDLSFPGTFHGVAGTYECTTPPCTVSTANDGMISSTGGTWTFTLDSTLAAETMIDLPGRGPFVLRVVAEGAGRFGRLLCVQDLLGRHGSVRGGRQKFTSGNNDGLLGTASYQGRAAGRYVTKDFTGGVLSGGTAGVFTAAAALAANFGGDDIAVNDQFNIRGSVTEFMDAGSGRPLEGWSVTLNTVDLAPGPRILRWNRWHHHHRGAWRRHRPRGPGKGPSSATPGPTASPVPLPVCSTLIYPPRIFPAGSAPAIPPCR